MTAPTTSVRVNPSPTHTHMVDGFSTKLSPAAAPSIAFWERTVTPMSLDTEEKIPLTTMFQTLYRTFAGRKLLTVGDLKATVFWYVGTYTHVEDVMGESNNGSWTLSLPDGGKIDFYAYLKSFVPKDQEEGKAPQADIELVVTNRDSNGSEVGPVFTPASGT